MPRSLSTKAALAILAALIFAVALAGILYNISNNANTCAVTPQ